MKEKSSKKAVEFLLQFIPDGLWVLTGIHPETRQTTTATFTEDTAAYCEEWIEKVNGVLNIYFSVNQPERGNYNKKLSKDEITAIHFLHVDVDPEKGKEFDLQRRQIFDKLTTRRPEAVPRPSVIIDSGGGYQAFWKLAEPQTVENQNQREAVELFNVWIAEQLGGDHCHNIDRIMRLPWTVNIPTDTKKKAGRVESLARPVQIEDISYNLTDFSLEAPEPVEGNQDTPEPAKADTKAIEDELEEELRRTGPQRLEDIMELQEKWNVTDRTLLMIREGVGSDDDIIKKQQEGKDHSRSEWLFDVVCELERRGVPRPIILGVITEPNLDRWKISESVLAHNTYGKDPLYYGIRQIRRAVAIAEQGRVRDQEKADLVEDGDSITDILYDLCRAERPKMGGIKTQEEAEELDPLLKVLNKRFTYVKNVGSKPRIVSFFKKPEIGNGKTLGVNKVIPADFVKQYPMKVITGYSSEGKDGTAGKPITRKIMEWWNDHRWANVKDRITFAPDKKLSDTLNEWKGFTYEADDSSKCDLFLTMVKDVVCSGNLEHYEYVLDWCARMFQHPGKVGQVALVLKGGSGIGKSFFAQQLGELMVSNFYETAKMDRLTSNFNATLRTTVLLFLDEALFGGDKKQYDILKKLLVNNTLDVEAKGYEQETVANCLHVILASNHDYVVPAQFDDRRLLVLEVSDSQQKKREYFGPIEEQLQENENAGYKALFHFFRNRDLSGFSVDKVPQTLALDEQKEHALTLKDQWLLDKLWTEDLGHGRWPSRATVASLWKLYDEDNIRATKYDRLATKKQLSAFLQKTLQLPLPRSLRVTEPNQPPEHGKGWDVPTIQEARDAWDRTNWKRTDWPEIEQVYVKGLEPEGPEPEATKPETEVTEGKYSNGKESTPF